MEKRKNPTISTLKRCVSLLVALLMLVVCVLVFTSFVKYPEKYLSTWRYQLKCDIEEGNEAAISYYETNYLANGIKLFGEE